MCTLAFAWKTYEDAPLLIGANRDEANDRPSSSPAVRGDAPHILMPRDERAGGTWIGVNEHRLFVAVTNRWGDREGERSRGLLVADALATESARDAIDLIERELAEYTYAGCNLVIADDTDCVLLEWDGVIRRHDFNPGTHVVVNEGYDDHAEKSSVIRNSLEGETADAWTDSARDVLSDHDTDTCIHGDGFGTRSSSLITIESEGDVRYLFADGAPCDTPYRRVNNHI